VSSTEVGRIEETWLEGWLEGPVITFNK